MKEIKKVAVLGSGVMGGAIAAHLAKRLVVILCHHRLARVKHAPHTPKWSSR